MAAGAEEEAVVEEVGLKAEVVAEEDVAVAEGEVVGVGAAAAAVEEE